jgi:hypothetical protein
MRRDLTRTAGQICPTVLGARKFTTTTATFHTGDKAKEYQGNHCRVESAFIKGK